MFFVVEQIRLEFEPYQRETFINVIFMFVQISIRENSLLTTPWLLEKARLNQWANVKLTGGQKLCMPNLCFLHNLNLFKYSRNLTSALFEKTEKVLFFVWDKHLVIRFMLCTELIRNGLDLNLLCFPKYRSLCIG